MEEKNTALESALEAKKARNTKLEAVHASSKAHVENLRKMEAFAPRAEPTRLQPIPGDHLG